MPTSPSRSQNGTPKRGNTHHLINRRRETAAAAASSMNPWINHDNIFFFIPNLIGYTRVILAASSLYFMRWHPKYCTWLYILSCLLDAFDGMAARKFGQSMNHPFYDLTRIGTKFGSVLDMVTDRCTTACLLCYLCSAYPQYTVCFQTLSSVDLASHYMHMYRCSRTF